MASAEPLRSRSRHIEKRIAQVSFRSPEAVGSRLCLSSRVSHSVYGTGPGLVRSAGSKRVIVLAAGQEAVVAEGLEDDRAISSPDPFDLTS